MNRIAFAVTLAVWVAMIVGLMLHARAWALREMATPTAQVEWQKWRTEVQRANRSAPVQRRVPQSIEPPVLILMRDYFAVCLTGAILFGTLIFLVTAGLARGAVRTRERLAPAPAREGPG